MAQQCEALRVAHVGRSRNVRCDDPGELVEDYEGEEACLCFTHQAAMTVRVVDLVNGGKMYKPDKKYFGMV